jgi:hypothetical protein
VVNLKSLSIKEKLLLNQYVQGIYKSDVIIEWFNQFNESDKRDILKGVWIISTQARVTEEDILLATKNAGLKISHTPVRMLVSQKTVLRNRGFNLTKLRGKELNQAFNLILNCFALAEKRRKEKCDLNKEICNHWWHQDLSDPQIIKKILNNSWWKS